VFGVFFTSSFGQNPEEAEIVDNQFEVHFYEALKQKAIENYDKAITSLEKCLEKEKNIAEVYYQLGINYLAQNKYVDAEENFNKAIALNPSQRWYLNGLYDVYYKNKEYNKAIAVVEKLVAFDENMREDLASLFMSTQQFDKAKATIALIESKGPLTKAMESYKMQLSINNTVGKSNSNDLVEAIKNNPKIEQNYIDLIYQYSLSNQEDKAFTIAQKLAEEIPSSDWAHVSLVKFYISKDQKEQVKDSYTRVVKSSKVDLKIKHRVLNEFLLYTIKNPDLTEDLDKSLIFFNSDASLNASKEIAKFYYNRENYIQAEKYFEIGLQQRSDDIEQIDLLLNTYDFNAKFDKMTTKSVSLIDLFPTKANLYYYAGKGYNQQKNFKKAKEFLEMGIDYVIEDKNLEAGFCKQFLQTAEGLADTKLKNTYQKRLEAIKK
jgi:tetratricopeptide (TPR) repeat protein